MIVAIRTTVTTAHIEICEIRIREVSSKDYYHEPADSKGYYFVLELYGNKKNIVKTEPYDTNLQVVARILEITAHNGPIKI